MSREFNEVINELRHSKEFCDAKIIVDNGEEFLVHRNIVSVCSDYFRALFTTKLNPTSVPDEYVTISLEWVPEKIMKLVIDYAYTKELVIDADTVYDVYITVDYLRIDKAVTICAQYLIDHLTNQNCIETYDFGNEYLNQFIVKESERYILYNFSDISKENDDILEKTLEYVIKLLSSEHLYVLKEEEIWEFALRWVKAHEATRKYQISMVMREIRFGIMRRDYFVNEIKNHPFVTNLYSCKEIISETEKFYNLSNTVPRTFSAMETPKLARPRISHCVLFAIGGWSNGAPTGAIEIYDSKADRWSQIPDDPGVLARAYHGTVYLNNKIYMIGGFEGREYYNSCRCYDFKTDTWTSISPMNYRRCYVSVVVLNGLIYAIGGYDGHIRQTSAERYDPTINQWNIISPMNVARSDADATVLNNQIYITGGFNGHECLNSAEVYDPELDAWSVIPTMSSRRSGLSCITYHGCIYALGGFDGANRLKSVERFDPELDRWMQAPSLYTTRSNFTVQVIDDAIIAMGGFNGTTTIPYVEEFNISHGRWRLATDMNVSRSALSSCVVSNLPMDSLTRYIYRNRNNLMMERWQKLRDLNLRNSDRLELVSVDSNVDDNLS